MRVGLATLFLSLSTLCALARGAAAQDATESWAVVVASTRDGGMPPARRVAEHAAATLSASGETVLASDRSVARIESSVSRPFAEPPAALAERLGAAVEEALEDVAFGRNQHALDIGQPLLAQLDPFLAGLGHAEQTAQDVGNLCLYLVRAHLQKRDLGAATQQADVCLRLVPDLSPDTGLHPPDVIALITAARERLERGEGGILMVHGAPTDPRDCVIRVNGRTMGTTPWQRVPVPPGDYHVQIECRAGVPGRVHVVTVPSGAPTREVVRARFDEVLRSDEGLGLSYPSREELRGRLPGDVAVLGQALAVQRVAVVVSDGGQLVVMAFRITSAETAELVGSAPVPDPIDARDAIREVLAGRQLDSPVAPTTQATPDESGTSVAAEIAAGPSEPAPSAPAATRRREVADPGIITVGAVITLGALATLGTGWYFWLELEREQREFASVGTTDATYFQAFDEVSSARWPVVITATVGGAVATIGLPLLLPPEDGVPWYSWIFGAAGAGLAAYGIYELTQDGACVRERTTMGMADGCIWYDQRRILGSLVLAHATPLLSVPIIYAFRALGQGSDVPVTASVSLDETGGSVRVSGRF